MAWAAPGGDRCDIGSQRGIKIKATLQAPLLGSTHEAVAAYRRWAEGSQGKYAYDLSRNKSVEIVEEQD